MYAISCEGLLGEDVVELFLGDEAVLVEVGPLDHEVEEGVVHELAQLLGGPLEVLGGDVAGLLVVEGHEHLVDLLAGLVLVGRRGHQREELLEVDGSSAVLVDLADHVVDCGGSHLQSERVHGVLDL